MIVCVGKPMVVARCPPFEGLLLNQRLADRHGGAFLHGGQFAGEDSLSTGVNF
jgi:hypothetical protein